MAKKYESGLQKIIELQKKIRKIHPLLKKFYPVTIVEDKEFFLFDVNPKNTRYDFIKATRPAMIVPKGIRAAFPLDFYDDKMACVVTGDVFDDLGGYATIFHEFIHCAQMECCEQKLKPGLGVARKAQAAKDFMWELNHPFPYEDNDFEEVYTIFLELASKKDAAGVSRCRTYLKEMLNVPDYEYMVWQEWKEGFARLIENRVRKVLGLEENHGGSEAPYSRVSFYEGGSRYIETLFDADKELEQDIEELFHRMFRGDR
ncbi:MAG: hypothetical protein JXB23_08630 [Candidatus Aminicenantes bacterium]|nr:hypothetical protein [Candidatus Aminicenantes bacterium]